VIAVEIKLEMEGLWQGRYTIAVRGQAQATSDVQAGQWKMVLHSAAGDLAVGFGMAVAFERDRLTSTC